jgi:hypothetical protein
MDRMTVPVPEGEITAAPGRTPQEILDRLSQYEDLHQSLLEQLEAVGQMLDALRAQDRTKSVTYRQLLAQRLTLRDLLGRIALYVK